MERTEDTDDDVDFLPLRPADERRMVDLGVRGDGDNDWRLYAFDVVIRGGRCDGVDKFADPGVPKLDVAAKGLLILTR